MAESQPSVLIEPLCEREKFSIHALSPTRVSSLSQMETRFGLKSSVELSRGADTTGLDRQRLLGHKDSAGTTAFQAVGRVLTTIKLALPGLLCGFFTLRDHSLSLGFHEHRVRCQAPNPSCHGAQAREYFLLAPLQAAHGRFGKFVHVHSRG